jgi:hypothetical protein
MSYKDSNINEKIHHCSYSNYDCQGKGKVWCFKNIYVLFYNTSKKKITWKFLEYKTCIKSLISSTKIILIKDNNEKDKI